MKILLIFLGGGLGAISRFALSQAVTSLLGIRFPLGILACNLLGCFLIGLAVGYSSKSAPDWFAPLLVIGFLGGFTTFSTFANDSLSLFEEGHSSLAFTNLLLSVIPGLLAVWGGLKISS